MNRIYIGMGTCGLASGAEQVKDAVVKWVDEKKANIRITATGCIGYCQAEPIVDVVTDGGHRVSFGEVKPESVGALLDRVFARRDYGVAGALGQYRNGHSGLRSVPFIDEHPFFRKQLKLILKNCGVIEPASIADYRAAGGFRGLERALAMTPERVVEEVLKSGLRGRGGGGFPTGKKWALAQKEISERKYIICNADEGDPGAFMDRSLLESDPFSVIEGMIIAGYAIGAREGVIYCRAEYPLAIERLQQSIEILKKEKLLESPLNRDGFSLRMWIKKGAGAFVCGEETALMASIEGKRGMPKPRPPYPAVSGLFEKPTVINNVETLANVTAVLREGAESFASLGTPGSKGTKVFALTGKVNNTGLVEVPMGIRLREIIEDIGGGVQDGKEFKAVQIGGPSGGCIPEKHMDIEIDYESLKSVGAMMGSGGLVVMDEDTCMVDVARFFLSFITRESCGKCIPCREGTQRMYEILDNIVSPYSRMKSEKDNLARFNMVMNLENLAQVIKDTSLCGLGQSSPNPVLSTLRFFRDEYEAHIYDRTCPARQCKGLLNYRIDTEKCTGCTACAKKCPASAVVGEAKKAHYIIDEKCTRCGTCAEVCRFDAVRVS
jgi:NADH:ubiquinone oxidoreductase subunit F (NADH-binding)/(2Fe-2S) ferredoxin/Pyruvate/2-oxoacid:ferredoxin oxidoreductase delta subunit